MATQEQITEDLLENRLLLDHYPRTRVCWYNTAPLHPETNEGRLEAVTLDAVPRVSDLVMFGKSNLTREACLLVSGYLQGLGDLPSDRSHERCHGRPRRPPTTCPAQVWQRGGACAATDRAETHGSRI